MSRLFEQDSYPIRAGCKLLELSRSRSYYAPVQVNKHSLETATDEIGGEFPVYGARRVMHQLRRSPYEMQVNRKRVRRIMAQIRVPGYHSGCVHPRHPRLVSEPHFPKLTLTVLRAALEDRQPGLHNRDQGIQYAAFAYVNLLKSRHFQISMAAVGKAEGNGYAECFMRNVK